MEVKAIWSEWEDDHYRRGTNERLGGCISYPCLISDERAESSYGQIVLVIDGRALGVGEVPPGEAQVPPDLLQRACDAGYPAQPLTDADRAGYWAAAIPLDQVEDIDGHPITHWHPDARLVQY